MTYRNRKSLLNWSGSRDSNAGPLPPEECRPYKTGGISPFYGANDDVANREMAVVTVTVIATGHGA